MNILQSKPDRLDAGLAIALAGEEAADAGDLAQNVVQAAYLLRKKTPPDKPRLNDVLRQVACIGGFLARKSDGEPGVKTIWLGLKDVHVAAETIRTLRGMGALKSCV